MRNISYSFFLPVWTIVNFAMIPSILLVPLYLDTGSWDYMKYFIKTEALTLLVAGVLPIWVIGLFVGWARCHASRTSATQNRAAQKNEKDMSRNEL
jgi:hypothetical protein